MKKRYFAAIRAGRKTTTLRYWRRPHVRAGSVHLVPGLGRIRIEGVQAVEPAGLAEADARADGFPSLAALRAALSRLYPPGVRDGRRLYLVRFAFLGTDGARPALGGAGTSLGSARNASGNARTAIHSARLRLAAKRKLTAGVGPRRRHGKPAISEVK